ncbi:DNA polymerase III subunit gamma/tau [Desulfobacter hydrogenophilus]|uniref:DNA polymerase III subunit gamma/tau n=1 Tax=Desulfobacter hydrogenophilus TaxID=2291 RepID=A0A328FG57_9BACT|nr:DNA polymerase III subunit gamma/tau [Desulfobacter hydrogenophilus]NDY70870.1 DNA polymerase III subunit gamma/tau [Desulfobacter hydrogenophilus]QBH11640.1 DNA polymerase III subunit gamma/tau [Desulfobacter hydrogenophilus]RAM03186.1 DNA polymerase III subunit gamma/tau [Desulfobacter hydrogenophilus]
MSYQVLALKYRPQTFSEVVGQDHVTTTLTNAISGNRVPHALLLAGPRGTGKTTIARIMAKAMTCQTGPTPSPCNECRICKDIINGHCADVFEIDGASNNSVEQIRELRDNVAYMPSTARYKIYIIDEVHMLSVAAFNALLKTLEEPPEHVLFIFATTEVHKIPATILSRCQRHDLSRIALDKICAHLENLCRKEDYTVEKEGLELIALEADGSIRDGLSLLDRILSAGPEKEIDRQMIAQRLRGTDRRVLFSISSAVLERNGAQLIDLVSKINDSGMDLKEFYSGIIAQFRNLNIIRLCGKDSPVLNMIETEKLELDRMCKNFPSAYLGMLLDLLLKEESIVRFASHTQTAVEMVLLKMIQIEPETRLDEIITKVDLLARQMENRLDQTNVDSPPTQYETPALTTARPAEQPPDHKPTETPPLAEPRPMPIPEPPPYEPEREQTPSDIPDYSPDSSDSPGSAPPVEQVKEQQRPATWTQFMDVLQQEHPFIFGLFSKGQANTSALDKVIVTLASCSGFEKSRLDAKSKALAELGQKHLGKFIEVSIENNGGPADETCRQQASLQKAEQAAAGHPMVQHAVRLFDADII